MTLSKKEGKGMSLSSVSMVQLNVLREKVLRQKVLREKVLMIIRGTPSNPLLHTN